jgi:hypothetical protein
METKNMPVVVQLRKQEDYAGANSYFSESVSLAQNLKIVRRGNEQFYRLYSPKHSQIGVDIENQKYLTTDITVLESVFDESNIFSDSAVFDTQFTNSIKQNLAADADEDFDDSIPYGVQVIEYPRKVLFTQEVEINTKELKRWKPDIIIEPFLLDDDE